jgi:acyl-CoA dehydrogenase
MRGIYNRPYTFVIEFDEQAIFSCDFGVIARETMTPSIQIFWAAVWSGIAWSALSKLKRFVIKEISRDKGLTGPMQHGLTELVSKHYMINSMVRDVIGTYEEAGDSAGMGFGLSAKLNRVKVKCSELAREICLGALGIIGIRGYALSGPYSVAEEVTDILSGEIMVSNYRLSMNTAKIERFVDENLFPTVHQVTHGRE